jgi:hypoxanthine phosphoribosyltransferase
MNSQDQLKEIISPDVISARVRELGERITMDYQDRPIVIIGILNGAFVFMSDLVRHIKGKVEIDFVRLKSYGAKMESLGQVSITKDIELEIEGKDIIVVEDIADTGYTLKYLSDLLKLHNPASVKICCLIDKKERRQVEVVVDYVGFDIPHGFLVGYGLDFNEMYRHLPGIYHLNPGYTPEGYAPSDR